MNIAKKKKRKKQIHREQISGYQWREGNGEGQYKGKGLRGKNYCHSW